MNETKITYPCSISDATDEGMETALDWCLKYIGDNQTLILWTKTKKVLRNNDFLIELSEKEWVDCITPKDSYPIANGPILAMYPSREHLGHLTKINQVQGLAIVAFSSPLCTWVEETKSEVLVPLKFEEDDYTAYETEMPEQVRETLISITKRVNHNNSIKGNGYEKNVVVKGLLELHDAGYHLPSEQIIEWAAANGWRRDNPSELGKYANDINKGKRPQIT